MIGSLIQKIWGENQGHLTLYIFQKKFCLLFYLTTHSISFHFTSFHFISFHSIPLHLIHSINKNLFMTISIWSFVICSFLFQPSNSCVSFRSWQLFPQLTPVSAARSRFRSYYYSVFKKNVQLVVVFIKSWNKMQERINGTFKTLKKINQLKTKGKSKDSKGMNNVYFK